MNYEEYQEALDYYLEYVNTDLLDIIGYDISVYIAYGMYNNKPVSTIKEWYTEAEDTYIYMLEEYIINLYGTIATEGYFWHAVDDAKHKGIIYEVEGMFFEG